jgi:hypothetical protein
MVESLVNVPTKLLALSLGFVILLNACSGGGDEEVFPDVVTLDPDAIQAVMNNSEVTLGRNRLVFFFREPDGRMLVDASVHLVFYDLTSGEQVKRFETDAVSVVPARDAGIEEQIAHIHADGSRHVHLSINEEIGFYTAMVDFDKPGNWGVQMQLRSFNPEVETVRQGVFTVQQQGVTPAIGAPAPRSDNPTLSDVSDISQIDSAVEPNLAFHQLSIADAIAAGKPSIVLFSTPGFCQTALCGPEYEIFGKLHESYGDRVEFVHVEVYKDPATRLVSDTMLEWKLQSEPWFFVIDSNGLVAAKFEGPASLQELEDALKGVS